MPEPIVLDTYLWDVRSHIERQLRCMTAAQKNLKDFHVKEHPALRAKIIEDLRQISESGNSIADGIRHAIAEAEKLPDS